MKPHNSVVQLLGVVANPLCVVTGTLCHSVTVDCCGVVAFYQNGSLYTLLHSDKEMKLHNKLNVIYGTLVPISLSLPRTTAQVSFLEWFTFMRNASSIETWQPGTFWYHCSARCFCFINFFSLRSLAG